MQERLDIPRVPMQITRGCLLVSMQIRLDDATLRQFQSDVLACIRSTEVRGVICDVSSLEVLDSEDFAAIYRTLSMVSLMGVQPILVGLKPGVVSALVDTGIDLGQLDTALDLDTALRLLLPHVFSAPQSAALAGGAEDEANERPGNSPSYND